MERNDLMIGLFLIATIIFISYGNDTAFLYSTAINLFILGIYFMMYYDFTNYRSHSQYLLKREIKPFYSSLMNGVLLLGIGRIINNYGYAIRYWNTSLYPSYQLLVESLFAIIMIILLVRFIVYDVLEFSLDARPLEFRPRPFTKPLSKKEHHHKSEPSKPSTEKHEEVIRIKKEETETEEEAEKEEIKRLPVIIITTDE
ncbi:MAG: hypothetical protein GXN99_03225 [Candidatus Nanohaloarchaeota archaeon]|nr:hypothetical protein [Candidatus Nanohaloarchaeota archaeon]